MMKISGIEEVAGAINSFAEGNAMHFETEVAEGVTFDFDCPYEEDLMESTIPVAVQIESWSPYNEGEPEKHRLMDYSEEMDELVCDLDEAFHNGGSRNEEVVFEYSKMNSHPEKGVYVFLASIGNPRISVRMSGNEVREEYA